KFNLPANTNISYIPYSLQYETGQWEFKINSGYITFAAPKNVVPVIEGAPLVTDVDLSPTDRYRNPRKDGFGDVYLSAKYSIENPYSNDFYIDLTGRIKIPTANEYKGLGTGKVDYIVKADFAYLMGNFMPFATLGYRFVGKTHLYDLQDSFFASIGASYYLTYDTSIGVSYEYRESATPGFNSPKEIFAYTDVQINDHWGLNLYGVVGLNNVTTDYGLGTQIRYKF
ncbi:MAG TPA: transporter, partial [Emcibacteraceae bacterium]|nr:transporter [Emcibacteraceae bacterium]